eukprot:TRINITY_DN1540_c1_g1_i7.p1 TRINITY_DN1540_c1_g1~~TRINITY_DN1540_c1_g1_i7.p1  ORF type:complete len:1131 (+),score=142.23 TRINITY_DN1540_c1_g1_i7:75-3395(+)
MSSLGQSKTISTNGMTDEVYSSLGGRLAVPAVHTNGATNDDDDAVFDLSLDDEVEGDILLDWQQYSKIRRTTIFGVDCSWINSLPCFNLIPPEKWYSLSRRQRRIVIGCSLCCVATVVLIIIIAISVALSSGGSSSSSSSASSSNNNELSSTQSTRHTTPSPEPSIATPSPELVAGSRELCSWSDYRLPSKADWIRPINYKLDLNVSLEPPYSVLGEEVLDVLVNTSTYCVVLHAADMNVTRVMSGEQIGSCSFDDDSQQMIIEFDEALQQGSQKLSLEFNYELSTGLGGFYLSTQNDSQGQEYEIATTQFEAISARKAFPCMDEPSFKATFDVSLSTPLQVQSLFNTPQILYEQLLDSQQAKHTYERTPPMSPYTAAFVVGQLQALRNSTQLQDGRSVPVKIWAVPVGNRLEGLETSLQLAVSLLPKYEQLFQVDYMLSKLDLAAIPDFAAGAMENWGLITFRETALLVDPNLGSISDRYAVGYVVAHEMAHLWFGDYVTMEYWGDLWLNEGFATYFENIGAVMVYRDYPYLQRFYSSIVRYAMQIDQVTTSSRALSVPFSDLDNQDVIESAFDPIVYEKGGSLLRMLHAYLLFPGSFQLNDPLYYPPENDPFLQTLSAYLQQYGNSTATSSQLWEQFDRNLPSQFGIISEKMKTWTFEKGLPVVTVQFEQDRNHIVIKQGNYSGELGIVECGVSWWIPIMYKIYQFEQQESDLIELTDCDEIVMRPSLSEDGFVKLNFGQFGYYRVQYDNELWQRLVTGAQNSESSKSAQYIADVDFAGLLDDSYNLASIGELNISTFFELAHAVPTRAEGDVSLTEAPIASWEVLYDLFSDMKRILPQECIGNLSTVVSEHIVGEYLEVVQVPGTQSNGIGFEPTTNDEPPVWRQIRQYLLKLGGDFGNVEISSQANTLVQTNANGLDLKQVINPDVRSIVYTIAVQSGQQASYDLIKNQYLTTEDVQDKRSALIALGAANDPILVQELLQFSLTPEVKSQDLRVLFGSLNNGDPSTVEAAWNFIVTHFGDYKTKFGGDDVEQKRAAAATLSSVGSHLATEQGLQDFVDFFDQIYPESPPLFVSKGRGKISQNIKLSQTVGISACEWLANHLE